MNHLQVGDRVPSVVFRCREDNAWLNVETEAIFANKSVIVFALPGAFTPTCSSTHLPRYNELAPVFFGQGVDAIYCLSVNDAFVMDAWAEDQQADNIQFLPDGNGEFSEAMGMLVDKRELGFGMRSWRYAMLVENGVIKQLFVEPDVDGDPFEVSDADTMLHAINPAASLPARVSVLTKPGCPHCTKAKQLLRDASYSYEEIALGSNGLSYSSLAAITGAGTTPQVFIDGQLIGGAEALEAWLKAK